MDSKTLITLITESDKHNRPDMALNEGSSFVVSSIISLLLFSGMQVYKAALASSQMMTILAGFTGSLLFVFLLTALANLEKSIFGFNFQTKLGEVSVSVRSD